MQFLAEEVTQLQAEWDLDPACIYLNHGSFGPSPRPVRQAREAWSRRVEQQPMRFYCQEMEELLEQACATLAEFLRTSPARVVLLDNATFAMNTVAASIELRSGDEVLLTDHEYGAVRKLWGERCRQANAGLITATLPFPPDASGVVEALEACLTSRTRLLVISHVTSPTACILPVQQICQMARSRGVPVCVDGPHAVAMLDVRPDQLGCDFYCGSCHKWLCGAFGSGFLWVHPRQQAAVRFPLISWGGSIAGRPASWKDHINWLGTRDPAALLSVAAAVEFFSKEPLQLFRRHAHQLLTYARSQLLALPGFGAFCTARDEDFVSMCGVELPQPVGWKPGYHGHPDPLQQELREQYGIEVPVASWNGHRFMRISAHLYNTGKQMDALVTALRNAAHL